MLRYKIQKNVTGASFSADLPNITSLHLGQQNVLTYVRYNIKPALSFFLTQARRTKNQTNNT